MSQWVHLPVRSFRSRLLFESWEEALLLWQLLTSKVEVIALVLMPDHIHVLCRVEDVAAIRRALAAYSRMRNARRRESGQVWSHRENSTEVKSVKQLNTVVAYIHRNPVVDGLVNDPLAWPFSTHRDALGLAIPCVRRVTGDPQRLHEEVCLLPGRSNPPVRPLPAMSVVRGGTGSAGGDPWEPRVRRDRRATPGAWDRELAGVRAAVASLTRTTELALRQRGAGRSLLLRAARCLTQAPAREVASFVGVSHTTALRAGELKTREVQLVERVLGDDRFGGFRDGDLRRVPGWEKYRGRS